MGFNARHAWVQTPDTSPQRASQDGFLLLCNWLSSLSFGHSRLLIWTKLLVCVFILFALRTVASLCMSQKKKKAINNYLVFNCNWEQPKKMFSCVFPFKKKYFLQYKKRNKNCTPSFLFPIKIGYLGYNHIIKF